jgi:hypothetical protein
LAVESVQYEPALITSGAYPSTSRANRSGDRRDRALASRPARLRRPGRRWRCRLSWRPDQRLDCHAPEGTPSSALVGVAPPGECRPDAGRADHCYEDETNRPDRGPIGSGQSTEDAGTDHGKAWPYPRAVPARRSA